MNPNGIISNMLDLLAQSPVIFAVVLIALVVSLSVHEFAHAWVSDKLGDPTARQLGRVTLNPRAHVDPLGMLLLVVAGFGWGRPVPFNPGNLKYPKRDSALIALAGPGSNFILAVLAAVILKFVSSGSMVGGALYLLVFYNLMLGVFNLMPFHPLDGFKIVGGLLPNNLAIQWYQMQPYGIIILVVFIFTDSFQKIVLPVVGILTKLLGLTA
ncbi:MAG: Peptidase M50 [candidate division WWE3 bacterium GW2011_GWE2_43_18]|nr:MAG: Peptidase M50 [candidate division WWE3 bacterium GW2011_GWB1_42_117]KKS54460.1 MAG: Peptidase M50 [candidate division WWE3 bacterium GW2011_GWD2_42_34]KKT04632.1 MAG: Peptidase M50 [candidate division WWE3 bacterium GW2011_GWE2_43_18]KKT06229.1 MAG: Peptidase M50 [candidate division WWE3 bacterium GW2011_GWF2_43_18]KKT08055.1 MAG: Peptidase M50 [candidate division WWE3 bacterium GW2011_GWD1_43_201]KKT10215.1 MAG: Peptidase M50 [candidate division WWE3 bacterium GW2011_GWA2_43_24]KKT26